MWNSLLKPLKVPSVHQIDINIFKHKFRKYLLKQQEIGDETAWSNATQCKQTRINSARIRKQRIQRIT